MDFAGVLWCLLVNADLLWCMVVFAGEYWCLMPVVAVAENSREGE